jgi:hypothetical protein
MILLRPSKKQVNISIAPKDYLVIGLGSYIEVDSRRRTITVKNLYTNNIIRPHASGKTIFTLNEKYMTAFLEKLELSREFEKHKLHIN